MLDTLNLHQCVQEFDRCLGRDYLASLSLDEAQLLLGKIDTFHEAALALKEDPELSSEQDYLIAVGCRLTADLAESILMRVVDILGQREQELDVLHAKLRKRLKERHQASMLLNQARQSRNLIHQVGQSAGLGVVL
ncbi:MAG: hypothetical protein KTR14_00735 [Vampirovibrio sp.]|nr:hypothetical protein [Vampirovibrio sp.]